MSWPPTPCSVLMLATAQDTTRTAGDGNPGLIPRTLAVECPSDRGSGSGVPQTPAPGSPLPPGPSEPGTADALQDQAAQRSELAATRAELQELQHRLARAQAQLEESRAALDRLAAQHAAELAKALHEEQAARVSLAGEVRSLMLPACM
jgi:hypothetical protein